MRPLANLGAAARLSFRPRAVRGQRRPQTVQLAFRPVNVLLRNAYQARHPYLAALPLQPHRALLSLKASEVLKEKEAWLTRLF